MSNESYLYREVGQCPHTSNEPYIYRELGQCPHTDVKRILSLRGDTTLPQYWRQTNLISTGMSDSAPILTSNQSYLYREVGQCPHTDVNESYLYRDVRLLPYWRQTNLTSTGRSDSAPILTSWYNFCAFSIAMKNDGRTVAVRELSRWEAGREILWGTCNHMPTSLDIRWITITIIIIIIIIITKVLIIMLKIIIL